MKDLFTYERIDGSSDYQLVAGDVVVKKWLCIRDVVPLAENANAAARRWLQSALVARGVNPGVGG